METEITPAEREAIYAALSSFLDVPRTSEGQVERIVRWTKLASFPLTEKADVLIAGNPPVHGLMTSSGTRPWTGKHFDYVSAQHHRVEAFSKLAHEFFFLVFRRPYKLRKTRDEKPERDELAVLTFEQLDEHLQRVAEAMAENIAKEHVATIKTVACARDRWIEDIPDGRVEDIPGGGVARSPDKWVRISDEVLNDLAALACSQRAALSRGVTAPMSLVHAFGGIHDVTAYRHKAEVLSATAVEGGRRGAAVPVLRPLIPKGLPLLLPTSDHPDEQIGEDGTIPFERLDDGHMFRGLLMLTHEFQNRPRDAYGERSELFTVNIGAMLKRHGLSDKGSVRGKAAKAIEALQQLKVKGAAVDAKTRYVVVGGNGEEVWEPLLAKFERRTLGKDGKEYQSGAPQFRFAGSLVAALRETHNLVQIREESLGLLPETLMSLTGLAMSIRGNIAKAFENERREYRVASQEALVRSCFRCTRASAETITRQFAQIREWAGAYRYGAITLAKGGEVVVVPDEWFFDVYAAFDNVKARKARDHRMKKKGG